MAERSPFPGERIVMNIDRILNAFEAAGVDYILIGGVNFLLNLRHISRRSDRHIS